MMKVDDEIETFFNIDIILSLRSLIILVVIDIMNLVLKHIFQMIRKIRVRVKVSIFFDSSNFELNNSYDFIMRDVENYCRR